MEKKGDCPVGSTRTRTSNHCGFIILECDLSQLPQHLQALQYACKQDAVNQLLLYATKEKTQLHSLLMCFMLVNCGKEKTKLASFPV